ncbi:autotransporter domain-containing protein [Alkalicaulis satelles]|uniref:Autotransporter domain-containing protein n=1 Tax=Alkalicaulis satelles TaxID=2609175 RepID=A0A5M6ZI23_9PROT|nr:autotransporter outer membrane beta-barrel domain-containing protein [Alkalicaulis satelles]KAA5804463.1 autotransporter domain-containing protein [Alkalicaulis satelles]
MRRSLLAAASTLALAAAPAIAEETRIEDERTSPINTASAGNIVIAQNGRVTLTGQSGPAVRVNSDNTVTTEVGSRIEITDEDGAIGIQVDPGVEGGVSHGGAIVLGDSFEPEDENEDGVPRGPFAEDRNKTGILIGTVDGDFNPVAGQDPVTGSITALPASRIEVVGQDSFGVRSVTDVDGDMLLAGQITIRGERSIGVSVEGDVSGDVEVSRISAQVPEGHGVSLQGDVGGGVRLTGQIEVSGYRVQGRVAQAIFENLTAGEDDIDSGAAVLIAGSVQNGVFIASSGSIASISGGGAGVEIRPGEGASEDQVIGEAVLPPNYGLPESEQDEDAVEEALGYSVVNRGTVAARGIFDGKNATAFLIAGRDVNGDMRAVILTEDGFLNTGSIDALAYDADAIGLHVGAGAQMDTFHNRGGEVRASALLGFEDDGFADDDHGEGRAFALVLDEESQIRRILNERGSIIARVERGGTAATAITVNTGSLERIDNSGVISAQAIDLVEGASVETIAIDARNHHNGLIIRQTAPVDDEGEPVANLNAAIVGDVLLGDGDDTIELLSGQLLGNIAFGGGNDTLIINGARMTGSISNSSGDLDVSVTDGRITLTGTDTVELTNAIFHNGGVLDLRIESDDRTQTFINASGEISFLEGSDLSISLSQLVGSGRDFQLITAQSLVIDDENEILSIQDAPYIYNARVRRDENDPNSLILTLERKTADELGFDANRSAAYNEALAVFDAVTGLNQAIASLSTQSEFFGAYDQLLPDYVGSAIEFALASNDATAGALAARLENARRAPDQLAGVWVQEFAYFIDRAGGITRDPGYRGQGIGLAAGVDIPWGPFYAVGLSVSGSASDVRRHEGFNDPMVALTGQLGAYFGMDLGGVDVSGSMGVGFDRFETERTIRIQDFSAMTLADWSGWHFTASGRVGRDFNHGRWLIRPEATLTYLTLFESAYNETTDGINADASAPLALYIEDRDSSTLLGAATLTAARRFGNDTSWWLPSLRVGYRGEFSSNTPETVARFGPDGAPFILNPRAVPGSGVLLGFGLSAGSNYSTFTFGYDADIRDDFVRHTARIIIRLAF